MVVARTGTIDGPLPGGTANRGRVVKVGDTVRRPAGAYSPAVHALLTHIADEGFTHAPTVVALDGNIEVLSYLYGDAAIDPIPQWALTTEALTSVGVLLRQFHESVASFDGNGRHWQRPIPKRWRGPIVTHNDTHPANIIFRDGRATGLIDFDLAAAGCAAWELAVAACFWAPLRSDADIRDARRSDQLARFRQLLDGYGADEHLRHEVVDACIDANQWIADIIQEASELGHPAFGRLWSEQADMYARAHEWLGRHRAGLDIAVR
jgi:Ser/Thr protein kinase RdoA (MazF antagonist)